MRCRAAVLTGLQLALAIWPAASARAASAGDGDPWILALSSTYVITDMSTGDLDGDGRDETVVCYREDVGRTEQKSGVAVLAGKAPGLRPVFHVQLEVLCEKARVQGRKLGILLQGNKQLVWTYGQEIRFRTDRAGFLGQVNGRASSHLTGNHKADKAIDGDLSTSWAEGAPGTGLGQTLTLTLPRAVNLGAIAIYPGNGSSARAFFDSNRIHRGSLAAKSEADLGDATAGIDFASLGIESLGDRIEFNCENKPQVTYINVDKKGVLELQLRIESVYLGDKKDDTHVAEIELVPILPLSETLDRATPARGASVQPPAGSPQAPHGESAAPALPAEPAPGPTDAVRKLDEGGRSVIHDDDL